MKWLSQITRWWRGKSDPAERAEAERLQEQIDTRRGSASGPGNPSGASGTHGHESDFRDP
jgi:hypothetical protein